MEIQGLFAAFCVGDMDKAEDWYTKLLGRVPDDRPMDGLIQWRGIGSAGIQIVRDEKKAGGSIATIVTPDMDKTRADLKARGLKLEPDVQGDFGIIAQISDPFGNRITLAEPPSSIAARSRCLARLLAEDLYVFGLAALAERLGLAHPVIAFDTAAEIQVAIDPGTLGFLPSRNLRVSVDAEPVERFFDLRADAGDQLQVVRLLRPCHAGRAAGVG